MGDAKGMDHKAAILEGLSCSEELELGTSSHLGIDRFGLFLRWQKGGWSGFLVSVFKART